MQALIAATSSRTELKVAQLIRDGKTNKEIAEVLRLCKSTSDHRHHIRVKLGIKKRKSTCALFYF